MKTSDLVKMAKTTKKATSTITNAKRGTNKGGSQSKKIEELVEFEEDREVKAKKTVEKLLEGISFNPLDYKKKEMDEIVEYKEIDKLENSSNGNEWLEQQVTELTEINEYLRNQLANVSSKNTLSANYASNDIVLEDNNIKLNVVKLFMELQSVYTNVGFNYNFNPPRTNMIINPEQFMIRLLDFFPFLEEYRKISLH